VDNKVIKITLYRIISHSRMNLAVFFMQNKKENPSDHGLKNACFKTPDGFIDCQNWQRFL
jgi:hypothetical protein